MYNSDSQFDKLMTTETKSEALVVRKDDTPLEEVEAKIGVAFEAAQIRPDGEGKFVLQLKAPSLVYNGIEYEIFKNSIIKDLTMHSGVVSSVVEIRGKTEIISDVLNTRLTKIVISKDICPDVTSLFNSVTRYYSLEGADGVLYHGDVETGVIFTHDELIKIFSNEVCAIARGDGIKCHKQHFSSPISDKNDDDNYDEDGPIPYSWGMM